MFTYLIVVKAEYGIEGIAISAGLSNIIVYLIQNTIVRRIKET